MAKIDVTKLIGIGGTILGLAATLASGYSSKKEMEKTVADEVAKALANKTSKQGSPNTGFSFFFCKNFPDGIFDKKQICSETKGDQNEQSISNKIF